MRSLTRTHFETVPSRVGLPDHERRARERARARATERHVAATTGLELRTFPLPGGSLARRLQELAEREDAAAIVVGSSHRGDVGSVLAGTTAERLLHGAPCPVLVAPRGYEAAELRRVLVGHDGGDEAQRALDWRWPLGWPGPSGPGARTRIGECPGGDGRHRGPYGGPPRGGRKESRCDSPTSRTPWNASSSSATPPPSSRRTQDADLAIVGSCAYGPLASVLLGSVSAQLVRRAACPVMVSREARRPSRLRP